MLIRGEKGTAKSTAVRGSGAGAVAASTAAPAGTGRAADRRHRGPGGRIAGPAAGVARRRARVLAGAAGAGARRRAVRRRGQPAARPSGRRAAGRRGDGPGAHRARRRLAQPRRPVRADRHHESRRGRTAPAAARPVRADRRRGGLPRRRRAGRGDPRAVWRTRPTRRGSPRGTPTTTPSWPAGSPRPARRCPMWCCPTSELRRIAALCAAFDVDGMRADLVVARTAVAHAAWRGERAEATGKSRSTRRTSGSPPNSRCRTVVGATRSTTRVWIPDRLDDAMEQAGESADEQPEPEPEPDPPGGGEPVRGRSRR